MSKQYLFDFIGSVGDVRAPSHLGYPPGVHFRPLPVSLSGPHISVQDKLAWQFGPAVKPYGYIDLQHPGVVLLPRKPKAKYIDHQGDPLFPEILQAWFCSYDFWVPEDSWLQAEFYHPAFWRQADLYQLGYLVPPVPLHLPNGNEIIFSEPPFRHLRFTHSFLCGACSEVILARNGFSFKERAPKVLAISGHDIATPAGGDSTKRAYPHLLDEEIFFSKVIVESGLAARWKGRYGFDLAEAQRLVENEGGWGLFLDAIDKWSYTLLDVFELAKMRSGRIRNMALTYPLFGDVWQDIQFVDDGVFAFTDAEALYRFLLFRAYMHHDLYYNPFCRTYDFHVTSEIRRMIDEGVITCDELRHIGQSELLRRLSDRNKTIGHEYFEPQRLWFERFETKAEMDVFCHHNQKRLHHTDYVRPFNPGLHFPVFKDGVRKKSHIVPLRDVLKPRQVSYIAGIPKKRVGYYAYIMKDSH